MIQIEHKYGKCKHKCIKPLDSSGLHLLHLNYIFEASTFQCRDRKSLCFIKFVYIYIYLFQALCFWMMWWWLNDDWILNSSVLYTPFWISPKQNVSQTCSLSVYEFGFIFIGSRNCQIYFMRRSIWRLWESRSLWINLTLHYESSEVLFVDMLA